MTTAALRREESSGPATLATRALARVQSAARTGLHSAAAAAMWRMAMPMDEVLTNYGFRAARDSYDLHVRLLERPGMREVLRKTEREDLAMLPLFAALMPFDLLRVINKRRRGITALPVTPPDDFPYPDYYLNDFHNQSNGNLSLHSAMLYEWQIRFLFLGANRLQRQGVVDQIPEGDHLEVLDVGCGTASWITQARLQNRMHAVTGVDLSPYYLRLARLFRGRYGMFYQMNSENLRIEWTGRFDLVTCIWLFHELPQEAIERTTAEISRVLAPGGRLLFMDANQRADGPEAAVHTATHQHFGALFNEPHFANYQALDLPTLFARHGLSVRRTERWYASKLIVAEKTG